MSAFLKIVTNTYSKSLFKSADPHLVSQPNRWISKKPLIDRSKVPKLNENDLEEHYVSGSGPGGQSVNKSVNCCFLKHVPTGLSVKVHHTRSLAENRKIARQLLLEKLDVLYNGDSSVQAQKKHIAMQRIALKEAEAERRRALKEKYRQNVLQKPTTNVCRRTAE